MGKGPKKSIGGGMDRSKVPLGNAPATPGPAAYDQRKRDTSPSYTMRVRGGKGTKGENPPGPGTYGIPTSVGKGPKYSMGGGPSSRHQDSPSKFVPGPGAYEKNVEVVKSKSPSFTMRLRSQPFRDRSPSPGPDSYGVPPSGKFQAAPKYSLGARLGSSLDNPAAKSNPSPANYLPTSPSGAPKFSFRGGPDRSMV